MLGRDAYCGRQHLFVAIECRRLADVDHQRIALTAEIAIQIARSIRMGVGNFSCGVHVVLLKKCDSAELGRDTVWSSKYRSCERSCTATPGVCPSPVHSVYSRRMPDATRLRVAASPRAARIV